MRTVRYLKAEQLPEKTVWNLEIPKDHVQNLCDKHSLTRIDTNSNKEVELQKRLLSFGGCEVLMGLGQPDTERCLSEGEYWYGKSAQCVNMKDPKPFFSAIDFYKWEPQRYQLIVGYAMDEFGVWIPHAWTLRGLKTKEDRVTEVLRPMVGYFGYILLPEEVEKYRKQILINKRNGAGVNA